MTARQLLAAIADELAAVGIASARADARWLLLGALRWSAAELTMWGDRPLTATQVDRVRRLADRRACREPLQLVLGGTSFRGHPLMVRPGVFIPRPETEMLVDLVLDVLPRDGVVVETCAGSGAVACAIAAERPTARVIAIDRDPAAVALIRDNAVALGLDVAVFEGSLLDPVPAGLRGRVDVVVANPPYLAVSDVADLEPEVARWDPRRALVAGPSGHEVSDALLAAAPPYLASGGTLALELDERRVSEAARRAVAAGWTAVATHRDLAGRPRFVTSKRVEDPYLIR